MSACLTAFNTLAGSRCDQYWIGFSDAAREGYWTWADASPSDYFGWGTGQPDNYMGVQNYAVGNWATCQPGSWWASCGDLMSSCIVRACLVMIWHGCWLAPAGATPAASWPCRTGRHTYGLDAGPPMGRCGPFLCGILHPMSRQILSETNYMFVAWQLCVRRDDTTDGGGLPYLCSKYLAPQGARASQLLCACRPIPMPAMIGAATAPPAPMPQLRTQSRALQEHTALMGGPTAQPAPPTARRAR